MCWAFEKKVEFFQKEFNWTLLRMFTYHLLRRGQKGQRGLVNFDMTVGCEMAVDQRFLHCFLEFD